VQRRATEAPLVFLNDGRRLQGHTFTNQLLAYPQKAPGLPIRSTHQV
jgi:hypothetical protein